MLKIIGAFFVCLWCADFLTGFFHWLEDTYCLEHYPLIGQFICEPNIEHHVDPQLMVRTGTFISRNLLQWSMGACIFGLLAIFGSSPTLNAPQTSAHWLLLCFNVSGERCAGSYFVLAASRKTGDIDDWNLPQTREPARRWHRESNIAIGFDAVETAVKSRSKSTLVRLSQTSTMAVLQNGSSRLADEFCGSRRIHRRD